MILFLRSYKFLLAASLFHVLLNEENRGERSHTKPIECQTNKTHTYDFKTFE